MELMELYNQISNPIDDPNVIEKLIQTYSDSSKNIGGFYSKLTKTVKKQYSGEYYEEHADYFYSMMFNQWKNNVVNMSRDEFIALANNGSFGKDFINMRKYLETVPDVTTAQEENNILYRNSDKEIREALRKYNWRALGAGGSWNHVCSRYVTALKDSYPNIEHRLYINNESIDTLIIITLLVEKCNEHNLPYYFKFNDFGDRDDNIVIYSDSQSLVQYVQILNEIKKEYPELVSRLHTPPILTGKIDNWIGYGAEPVKTSNGKPQSFNEVRSKVIESCIDKKTKQWIFQHRGMVINYQGKQVSFQDYVALKATEKFLNGLEKDYTNKMKNDTNENVAKREGYTLAAIKSDNFRESVYKVIGSRMDDHLTKINNGQEFQNIDIAVRDGKTVSFSKSLLQQTIQELAPQISKHDSSFAIGVKEGIITQSKKYGIDTDKYCFDIRTKENLKKFDAQKTQEKYNGDIGQILINTTTKNTGTVLDVGNMSPDELRDLKKIVATSNLTTSVGSEEFNQGTSGMKKY